MEMSPMRWHMVHMRPCCGFWSCSTPLTCGPCGFGLCLRDGGTRGGMWDETPPYVVLGHVRGTEGCERQRGSRLSWAQTWNMWTRASTWACGVGRAHLLPLSSCSPPSCSPWSLLPSFALLSWICGPSIVVVVRGAADDTTVNAHIPQQGEGQ